MITTEIKRFVEERGLATVGSSDTVGRPHLALGSGIKVLDGESAVRKLVLRVMSSNCIQPF